MKRQRSNQLCACGCGEYTLISNQGGKKGKPNKYLKNHCKGGQRDRSGSNNSNWKGGKRKRGGYLYVWQPDHPKAGKKGYVPNACLVVEKAMGKYLPEKAVVHHVDEIRDNDSPKNLVACEDQAYHMLLHRRQRAYDACGHANWRKCYICQQYDSVENLSVLKSDKVYHKKCENKRRAVYREKHKDEINRKQREYGKKYRLENREKIRINWKKWYYKNKKEKAITNV